MSSNHKTAPNLVMSVIEHKCPHCRTGKMFKQSNPYNFKRTLEMYDKCEVCAIPFEPELGFYYGTGYVSYGLSVGITVASFIFTWLTFGFSLKDNSLFYWLGVNIGLLILLQPILMRISRVIWLTLFTKYKKINHTETGTIVK